MVWALLLQDFISCWPASYLCRQVDDLQFQLEEQGVISGDQLESATETSVQQVKSLTAELEKERKLTQELRDQLKVSKCAARHSIADARYLGSGNF